ncbi:Strictosidine conserved region, partial [Globisporangium splendens]
MVALRDVISPSVLLVAFFTALLSSALDQYPAPIAPGPVDLQYALNTVQQQTRFEQRTSLPAALADAQVLFQNAAVGAQGMAIAADGKAFVGLADGRIAFFQEDDMVLRNFSRTGQALDVCGLEEFHDNVEVQVKCGRPVGLVFAQTKFLRKFVERIPSAKLFPGEQVLLVADAYRGVYLFEATGKKTLLFNSVNKEKVNSLSGIAVSARGDIFVTDSSRRFRNNAFALDFLERTSTGQVIHFDPRTAFVNVIASELAFPNGIALVDNDSALLIALGAQNKIVKYTFTTKAIDDFAFVPGSPSGLSIGSAGKNKDALFVGLFTRSNRFPVEDLVMNSVKVRKLLSLLPESVTLKYMGLRSAFTTVDLKSGDVMQVYEEMLGRAPWVSAVHKLGDYYYLTSWHRDSLVRVPAAAIHL